MGQNSLKPRPARRSYSKQFKAEMVAQCLEGSTTLASLAVQHGMNPNVLHRWVTEHERYGKHSLDDLCAPSSPQIATPAPANWIALAPAHARPERNAVAKPEPRPPAHGAGRDIHVTLTGRNLSMTVHWPGNDQAGLARFARELLR